MSKKQDLKKLFERLYAARNEQDVDRVLKRYSDIFDNPDNWYPLGGDERMYGVVENQQAAPVAALIEKITNSIDAVLIRKCLESGVKPNDSKQAPGSMEDAVRKFFPDSNRWEDERVRVRQAENIQLIADGYLKGRSVTGSFTIYDNGEGQHPEDFENTFLSLLRGNKNDIKFVQGKYNMGGTGAIVFCGTKRYHMVASKRFDGTGDFGFTLVRIHPFTKDESKKLKNTWYEYFKIDEKIPSFPITELDLGLHNRNFTTGTVIKLYSYDLPAGNEKETAREINQSIDSLLFQPVLPMQAMYKWGRSGGDEKSPLLYDLYGLDHVLSNESKRYLESKFSEVYETDHFGSVRVTCYLFKSQVKGESPAETKFRVRRDFVNPSNCVLFAMNGQVQGSFSSEFITRSLKFHLFKESLVIFIDCSHMKYEFRKELFMASRDRLKNGRETAALRKFISDRLQESQLKGLYQKRKNSIGSGFLGQGEDLVKEFSQTLKRNKDLWGLVSRTLRMEDVRITRPKGFIDIEEEMIEEQREQEKETFVPQPYPTFFYYRAHMGRKVPVIRIPKGGEKTIRFQTDVANDYFDRKDDPGALDIKLTQQRALKKFVNLVNVVRSSPKDGMIKVTFISTRWVNVGDKISTRVSLTGEDGEEFVQYLLLEIIESKVDKKDQLDLMVESRMPEIVQVLKSEWNHLDTVSTMDYHNVAVLQSDDGESLDKIYINMDSYVIHNYLSQMKTPEDIELAKSKYISSVYFHVLFVYMINRKKKYSFSVEVDEGFEERTLIEFVEDLFDDTYSSFILNFGLDSFSGNIEDEGDFQKMLLAANEEEAEAQAMAEGNEEE